MTDPLLVCFFSLKHKLLIRMDKDDISNSQYIKPQVFVKISCTPQIFLLYENDEYLGEGGGISNPIYLCTCLFHVATQTNMILTKTVLLIKMFPYFISSSCLQYLYTKMQNWSLLAITNAKLISTALPYWQCLVNKIKHTDMKISISDIICILRLKPSLFFIWKGYNLIPTVSSSFLYFCQYFQ